MIADAIKLLRAYGSARFTPFNRGRVRARQDRLWKAMGRQIEATPALKRLSGERFADFPILDVGDFRQNFQGYTATNLKYHRAYSAAMAAETGDVAIFLPRGIQAGLSTGTSGGTRGLFVTSADERLLYVGQLLGKLLGPIQLLSPRRIALCLRTNNILYGSGPHGNVRFFALNPQIDQVVRDIGRFNPEILIAPTQVLLAMAEARTRLPRLKRLFWGAEVMSPPERKYIHDALGVRPDPIYQATEGFLAAPCRLGNLHLNEDSLIIEEDPISEGRFRPIVTDLKRRTQTVVRLRLDDILRPMVCRCGSPHRAIHPVEGRVQDIWRWSKLTVYPAEVTALISGHLPPERPWQVTGHARGIDYACETDADAEAIERALAVFGKRLKRKPYNPASDFPKRRPVRWKPAKEVG